MRTIEYENAQETKYHGTAEFPFNIYQCNIPLDFPLVPVHWHNDMEILYIKKGRGKVSLDLVPFVVNQGDIVVIPPGQLHSIEQYQDETMEYENIIFLLSMLTAAQGDTCTDQFFHSLMQRKLGLWNHYTPDSASYPALSSCLDAMDEICIFFAPGYQFAIKAQLFSLFHALYPYTRNAAPQYQNKSLDRLKDILKYVETHYGEKISIAQAADICDFSQSHFMKFFKKNMSVSFNDYLNDYRLTMASRLLVSSTDAVVDIAGATGFDNLSYFNRLFKRKYGCTPTAFRSKKRAV